MRFDRSQWRIKNRITNKEIFACYGDITKLFRIENEWYDMKKRKDLE